MSKLIKCSYANKYKAIYPPKCNNGKGCDYCNKLYYKDNQKTEFYKTELIEKEIS